ncbi:glycosyltransferase family 2 protein [Thermodesulfobacteriota bacterium]
MMLIIQIPCYNEAETLPIALNDLPRELPGFDEVYWLVIDDGSSDQTAEVAKACGVDYVIRHTANQGLAKAFMSGIEAAINMGADVIVNTDADNQYRAADIPLLIEPILAGRADFVIGERPIANIAHFSRIKKILQKIGSSVVRIASNTAIPDAPSGFRAISRKAAMYFNVFNDYTYTLETIIQAGQKNLAIASVPIQVNEDLRPSRLVKSVPQYIKRSIMTIVRIFVVYRPFRFFISIGFLFFLPGLGLGLRFLYYLLTGEGEGHIQSVVLSGALLAMGLQTMLVAFLSDLSGVNRKLLEDIQFRLKTLQVKNDDLATAATKRVDTDQR